MRPVTPTLRQLEYVAALARHLNFRQAAEACHVSQPSLSAQIQQLETLLGVVLFERDKRTVRATAAGAEMARRAEDVLRLVDDLVDAARACARPLSGPLRLGVIPTVAPYLLPRAVPALRSAWPELRLLLRELQTGPALEQLAHGELDILLLALEAELGDVETVPLFRDRFVAAVPEDDPLATKESISEADLVDASLLLLEEGHCLRTQALSVCDRAAVDRVEAFGATSLTTLVQMVAQGLGVTLLPEMSVPVETPAAPSVVVRPFEGKAPYRTIGLAWRRSSPRAEEYSKLADVLEPLGT